MIKKIIFKLLDWIVTFYFRIEYDFWVYYWSKRLKIHGENLKIYGSIRLKGLNKISIGRNCTINHGVHIVARGTITLGDNVTISPNVMIMSGGLNLTKQPPYEEHIDAPIVIGNNTWIATGVIVLPGVKIGENCVVAAGSVVNKDVESFTIVGGVPARFIKKNEVPNGEIEPK